MRYVCSCIILFPSFASHHFTLFVIVIQVVVVGAVIASACVDYCLVCCDLFETFWWKITHDYRKRHLDVREEKQPFTLLIPQPLLPCFSYTSTCGGRSHTHLHTHIQTRAHRSSSLPPPLSAVLANSSHSTPALLLCLPLTTAACSKALWGAQVNSSVKAWGTIKMPRVKLQIVYMVLQQEQSTQSPLAKRCWIILWYLCIKYQVYI